MGDDNSFITDRKTCFSVLVDKMFRNPYYNTGETLLAPLNVYLSGSLATLPLHKVFTVGVWTSRLHASANWTQTRKKLLSEHPYGKHPIFTEITHTVRID